MKLSDANLILRYFLADNEEQFLIASKEIENSELFLPLEVVAEVVYVLKKIYNIHRGKIFSLISDLFTLSNISTTDKDILVNSLNIYNQTSLDFVDCILVAYKRKFKYEIVTFDKKLKSFLEKDNKID